MRARLLSTFIKALENRLLDPRWHGSGWLPDAIVFWQSDPNPRIETYIVENALEIISNHSMLENEEYDTEY